LSINQLPTALFTHNCIEHSALHTRLYCTQRIAHMTLLHTTHCTHDHIVHIK